MKNMKIYNLGKIELPNGFFKSTTSKNYIVSYDYTTLREKKLGTNRDIHSWSNENPNLVDLNIKTKKN